MKPAKSAGASQKKGESRASLLWMLSRGTDQVQIRYRSGTDQVQIKYTRKADRPRREMVLVVVRYV
jgi:hypothetical protein